MSPTPHTSWRWRIVMTSTLLAVVITIYVLFPTSPSHGMAALGVIFFASNIALPSAGWIRFGDACRWIVWQLGRRGLKPPRFAVLLTLGAGASAVTDWLVMPAHLATGLALLAAVWTVTILAMWQPGRDTIRQWRDERLEERRLTRMDAHDSEDFNGKGLPRKDWAAFNEALAGVLREMRASEEQDQ